LSLFIHIVEDPFHWLMVYR